MTEKKRNDQHDDSYYDELIKQRIGEALRNQSRKERLDLAQLEAWVEADRQKRRAKMKRILAIASCFIIICAGTFSLKFAFDDDAVATAGKNDNKVNEEGNNVVVKPGEGDAGENTGGEEVVINKWEGIKTIKDQYDDLRTPEYVPEGCLFEKLTIEINHLTKKYTYYYSDGDKLLKIKQIYSDDTKVLYEYDRIVRSGDLDVYIKDSDNKFAFCNFPNDEVIYVAGNYDDNIIEKIINNLK